MHDLGTNRILAAQSAINILSDLEDWDGARQLSQEVVELIVMTNGRFLDCTDKQPLLQMLGGESTRTGESKISTYASIALQAGSDIFDVTDMLEACRGSILGHMIDNRADLDDLRAVAPNKAERFAALRDEIEISCSADMDDEICSEISCSANMDVRVKQGTRKVKAEAEMRACLAEIRNLEGFRGFLRGPTRSELEAAAAEGPIVFVNITSIRGDAIIVTRNGSVLLPLPELDFETVANYQKILGHVNFSDIADLRRKNSTYRNLLECLWVNCVKLIFQKLDDLIPSRAKFHVWWIGIGIASSLPFHAAGIYSTKKVCESALFRAISSYTPTLKFLMHDRQKLKRNPRGADVERLPSKPEMLIVTMPTTGGEPELDLLGVKEEGEKIQKIVEASFSAQHSLQPSAKEVKESMLKCQVVHFACHGHSILKDPLSRHLLLQSSNPNSATPIVDKSKFWNGSTSV